MKKLFVISFLVAQFSIFAQTINETWVKENYTKIEPKSNFILRKKPVKIILQVFNLLLIILSF